MCGNNDSVLNTNARVQRYCVANCCTLVGSKSVVGDVSDSPAGSNPDKDSALESDVSNSNSDTSEDNWDTVPPLEYADRRFSRFVCLFVCLFASLFVCFVLFIVLHFVYLAVFYHRISKSLFYFCLCLDLSVLPHRRAKRAKKI